MSEISPRQNRALHYTLHLLGFYWLGGGIMLAIQIGTMSDSLVAYLAGFGWGALLLGLHELTIWRLKRGRFVGRVLVLLYDSLLIAPQLAILATGRGRHWDVYLLALLGWALIALAFFYRPREAGDEATEAV